MNKGRRSTFSTKVYVKPKARRLRERRRIRRLALLGVGVALVGVAVGVAAWLSRRPSVTIQNVAVTGASVTSTTTVAATVEKMISGAYGGLFSRRDVFLYPGKEIEKEVAATFPAVLSAKATIQNGTTLSVALTERQPFALWCAGQAVTDPCSFMDKTGVVYAVAPQFSGPVYVRFTGALATSTGPAPSYASAADFNSVVYFLSSLKSAGLTVAAVDKDSMDNFTMRLQNGASLEAGPVGNFTAVLQNLETIFQDEKVKSALQNGVPALDYIDLRFGNKVYYKYKTSMATST